jgi:predicted restriction endonuclease
MPKDLAHYAAKFVKLRVDRASGNPAPHKPILLLAVIDLFKQDIIQRNGICMLPYLCKKHHWAFDCGWFGIDDDYRIVIPCDRFTEEAAVESRAMLAFRGESLKLPKKKPFMPSLKGLQWHRERWGILKN